MCSEAKTTVDAVAADIKKTGIDVLVHETDVDDNPELLALYSDEVPVVFIDGRQHTYWKVDAARLTKCIQNAAAASSKTA